MLEKGYLNLNNVLSLFFKFLLFSFFFTLIGCSSISLPFFDEESSYEISNTENKIKPLEVPPDLISPAKDRKFSIPASGSSSMSEFELSTKNSRPGGIQKNILPEVDGMEILSYGNHRVLSVNRSAEFLWPILRSFWINSGFSIFREMPEIGVLETNWFEDRKKIPDDFIRGILGKVFENAYDTGERDRYIMRLERISDDQTEISVAHKGIIEVVGDRADGSISWVNKPTDRKLEEDYLKQIMITLGTDEREASNLIKDQNVSIQTQLFVNQTTNYIEIYNNFDRSWRRVGMAIDRLEFSVEDRVRADGSYFIKYRDPTIVGKKKGFFSNLLSFGKKSETVQTYLVKITSSENTTKVSVFDQKGATNNKITKSITSILFEQLK
ncbi:MAG: hypothetical protein CBD16_03440 [Betaproteobacteria bacterium TMED156]|nr:MAG: hypothetical protein CBD16_03440 [Betaproteobacteria bacterium TMED156]